MRCNIDFVGVWDTVAALGFPIKWHSVIFDSLFPHKFHSLELSEVVNFARHALSLDEERKTFHPMVWEPIKEDQQSGRLIQVWFSGVHTDVGGGYKEEDLSNIYLKWMLQEAEAKQLIIYCNSEIYKNLMASESDVNGTMHNEQKGFPGKLFKREQRSWNKITYCEPCVHESVLKRTKNNDNSETPKYSS